MDFKNYKPLLHLLGLAVATYLLHKVAFAFFDADNSHFHYSLEQLYVFFSVLTLVLFAILLKVKQVSFEHLGMAYLAATSIQMLISYVAIRPILNLREVNGSFEKTNFFITFILFLLFETVLTIRLLNQKP